MFVIAFSLPTAKLVFVISEQHGVFQRPAAGIVALTTIATVVVLPLWVILVDAIWPTAFS